MKPLRYPVKRQIALSEDIFNRLKLLAQSENEKVSVMARILIEKALKKGGKNVRQEEN